MFFSLWVSHTLLVSQIFFSTVQGLQCVLRKMRRLVVRSTVPVPVLHEPVICIQVIQRHLVFYMRRVPICLQDRCRCMIQRSTTPVPVRHDIVLDSLLSVLLKGIKIQSLFGHDASRLL